MFDLEHFQIQLGSWNNRCRLMLELNPSAKRANWGEGVHMSNVEPTINECIINGLARYKECGGELPETCTRTTESPAWYF